MSALVFAVLIDMVGFGIILPMLPTFAFQLNATTMQIGILASIFSVFQFFAAIFFGILSDKVGRKKVLVITTFMIAISYVFTAFATSFTTLLLSRAFSGFFSGNIPVAFAAAGDLSTKETRGRNMGIISAMFGIGFTLGPIIAGISAGNDLANADFRTPSLIAATLSMLATLMLLITFKETYKLDKNAKTYNIIKQLNFSLSQKSILMNLMLMGALSLMLSGVETFATVRNSEMFAWAPRQHGGFWSFFSIMVMVFQISLSSIKKMQGKFAIVFGFAMFGVTFFGFIFAYNEILTIINSLFMAAGLGLLFRNINQQLSIGGGKNQQGLVFGISEALAGIGSAVGPFLFSLLYMFSPNILWSTSLVACIILVFLIIKYYNHSPTYR